MRVANLKAFALFCAVMLLSACGQTEDLTTNPGADLTFTVKEFKKQGGKNCIDKPVEKTQESLPSDNLCARVRFVYPEASSSANPELATKLNQYIIAQLIDQIDDGEEAEVVHATATKTLEQFASEFIDEYQQEPNNFSNWELERIAKVIYKTKTLLSLSLDEYGFAGGAHPFNGTQLSVVNLKNAQSVKLADLLNPNFESALNVEGEKAFRDFHHLADTDDLEEKGFSFENNVFRLNNNFAITEDGLKFIFNSYEIAPYAVGSTELNIPYENIKSLIRPQGELAELAL